MDSGITKESFQNIQSINPPVLIISGMIYFCLLFSYLLGSNIGLYSPIKFLDSIISHTSDSPTSKIVSNLRIIKFIIFIFVFITVTLTILFGVYNGIFGGNSDNNLLVYGIICACFFSIVLITFILLELVPYLVNIFENTLGYLYIRNRKIIKSELFNIQSIQDCNGIFITDCSNNPLPKPNEPDINAVSYDFLFTLMNIFNMNSFLKQGQVQDNEFNPTFNFSINPDNVDSQKPIIANLLYLKHSVGHFVWIYFASLICTFTSIKSFTHLL